MISEFMSGDHRKCDVAFATAEKAAAEGNLSGARENFARFHAMMEHHLGMEEQVLFPEFEQRSGNAGGPTQVMRMEHEQMRALFAEMAQALEQGSLEDFLGQGETLAILMSQHNMKEENILYPMTDQVVAHDRDAVMARMQQIESAA